MWLCTKSDWQLTGNNNQKKQNNMTLKKLYLFNINDYSLDIVSNIEQRHFCNVVTKTVYIESFSDKQKQWRDYSAPWARLPKQWRDYSILLQQFYRYTITLPARRLSPPIWDLTPGGYRVHVSRVRHPPRLDIKVNCKILDQVLDAIDFSI